MRRLMLLRHAKSAWDDPGLTDVERHLNERGREAAPKMGAYMRANGLRPDRVIVSAATRTRETWALIAEQIGGEPVFDRRIYEAAPRDVLDVIEETPDTVRTLLVVGHNPGLQMVGLHLARRDGAETRRRLNAKYPTAGLIVIDLMVEDWRDLPAEAGVIDRYVTPASIGAVEVDD